ncbi:MAG: type III pantothenate kinase [Gallionella sp.]|nr:type III pantothenate kinase [Gallionella sp.]
MKLMIDAGNTLIKSAVLAGDEWLHLTPVPTAEADTMTARVAHIPEVSEVWVSNVAGDEVAAHLAAACKSRGWTMYLIGSKKQQCGVSNAYKVVERLGSDRWASLIAAWQMNKAPTLVVTCGTATTIDALSGQGEFLGGLILPGLALMQSSLIDATAKLIHDAGRYAEFPVNTADAIWSGALQATCGAIQRQYALLNDANAQILLSGGAAQELQELLGIPAQTVRNLVLQGLGYIAREASKS